MFADPHQLSSLKDRESTGSAARDEGIRELILFSHRLLLRAALTISKNCRELGSRE